MNKVNDIPVEEIQERFELAVQEKAKRFAFDEKNFSISRLEEMKADYEKIVGSLRKFNASFQYEITLLALEVAIDYRLKNFKSFAELGILGEVV